MSSSFYLGQRFSFDGSLCSLRYIGPVDGQKGEWHGVEWDDSTRGKHDGSLDGRFYFKCKSKSKTAASFVRPSRRRDYSQNFISAVRQKYSSGISNESARNLDLSKEIEISGKIVEEVGFEKIRKQLAQLYDLKIVIVDGLRVHETDRGNENILDVCPQIIELDLSRNLIEEWREVSDICRQLKKLRSLRLNGNRLLIDPVSLLAPDNKEAFNKVTELGLDETLVTWTELVTFIEAFPHVLTISANGNELAGLPLTSFNGSHLTSLTLEYNSFTTLQDLEGLTGLLTLEKLHLKGNKIKSISRPDSNAIDNSLLTRSGSVYNAAAVFLDHIVFGKQLQYVDLSYNDVQEWDFVDQMSKVFPGLTSLRFSHNPVYENNGKPIVSDKPLAVIDETYMLTLARLGNLKVLNFSNITAADRTNAELFYLSRIREEIAAVREEDESLVTGKHARFDELCQIYGAPNIVRVNTHFHPDWLEARLIKFTFTIPAGTYTGQDKAVTKRKEIPNGFDIYQIKGIVGVLFDITPLDTRLIWETGEWDPVAEYKDDQDSSEDDFDGNAGYSVDTKQEQEKQDLPSNGKWIKREVELVESTRQVGNIIDAMAATVRVEFRERIPSFTNELWKTLNPNVLFSA